MAGHTLTSHSPAIFSDPTTVPVRFAKLTDTIRKNVTIDWTLRETVQAKLRVMVKRVLKKYGYPPDKQKKATQTVLEQASLICKDWAEKKA